MAPATSAKLDRSSFVVLRLQGKVTLGTVGHQKTHELHREQDSGNDGHSGEFNVTDNSSQRLALENTTGFAIDGKNLIDRIVSIFRLSVFLILDS